MIIDRENRAVFTHQLTQRRRGRPRNADPSVPLTVRVPGALFDAACRRAQAAGVSLPEVVRETLAREFPYSTNPRHSGAW
jgi:predicted HicB family RNase H-like nuclease